MYMCVSVCLWVCVHVFRCLQRSEEGIRYPGSGVTCSLSCPPWLLAYKFIHCKNKGCSQLLSHVSSPLNIFSYVTESQRVKYEQYTYYYSQLNSRCIFISQDLLLKYKILGVCVNWIYVCYVFRNIQLGQRNMV